MAPVSSHNTQRCTALRDSSHTSPCCSHTANIQAEHDHVCGRGRQDAGEQPPAATVVVSFLLAPCSAAGQLTGVVPSLFLMQYTVLGRVRAHNTETRVVRRR